MTNNFDIKKLRSKIFVLSLLIMGSVFFASLAKAEYYAEGVLKSTNMLAGVDSVDSIDEFFVSATIPADTSVFVKFSQDRQNYYSSTGTKEFWEELSDGSNNVDLSGLSWSGAALYYKFKLETTRATATPEVEEVRIDYTGAASTTYESFDNYLEGTFISSNILAGAFVNNVNSLLATTSVPLGTHAYIQFSEDGENFYSTSSVANAWDTLTDGFNNLDLSEFSSATSLYYKIRMTSIDPAMSPEIMEISVDYDGDPPTGSGDGDFYSEGRFLSTDLLTGSSTFAQPAYFLYEASVPGATSISVQFSNDGDHWYDSSGTASAWDSLSTGSFLTQGEGISLAALDWVGEEEFYYKIKLISIDSHWSPEVESAGLLSPNAVIMGGSSYTSSGPVAYWKFDEGYGDTVYDLSGNENNGTLDAAGSGANVTETAMWDRDGKFDGAMQFDGTNDSINMGNSSVFNFGTGATLSAWVKPTALQQGFVINKWTNEQEDKYINYKANGKFGCFFYVAKSVETEVSYPINHWYHVVCVYDGSDISIYVNDKLAGQNSATGDVSDSTGNLYIGRNPARGVAEGNYSPFAGLIDEVRIFNRALTMDDINKEYNQGSALVLGSSGTDSSGNADNSDSRKYCVPGDTATCNPPVLDLDFNKKSGDVVYDKSGNGNNGTLVNMNIATASKRGKYGSALEFLDSGDYINASNSINMDSWSALTVGAWIKYNEGVKSSEYTIASNWNVSAGAFFVRVEPSSDYIEVSINGTGGNSITNFTDLVVDSNWHYVVFTYSISDGLNAYLDGIQSSISGSSVGSLYNGASVDLCIGATPHNVTEDKFRGLIDDVKIYDYARTPAQIAWDYNQGKALAYWDFNDCSGDQVDDESGNGHHGTLTIGGSGPQTTVGACATANTSAAWYNSREGKFNSSLSLDGTDDYVDVGDTGLTVQTISFWIKPDTTTEDIIDLDGGIHSILVSSGSVSASGFASPSIYVNALVNGSVTAGTWNHILITTETGISADDLDIGRIGSSYFDGQIDDLRLYSYILNSTQIKTDYNGDRAVSFN